MAAPAASHADEAPAAAPIGQWEAMDGCREQQPGANTLSRSPTSSSRLRKGSSLETLSNASTAVASGHASAPRRRSRSWSQSRSSGSHSPSRSTSSECWSCPLPEENLPSPRAGWWAPHNNNNYDEYGSPPPGGLSNDEGGGDMYGEYRAGREPRAPWQLCSPADLPTNLWAPG